MRTVIPRQRRFASLIGHLAGATLLLSPLALVCAPAIHAEQHAQEPAQDHAREPAAAGANRATAGQRQTTLRASRQAKPVAAPVVSAAPAPPKPPDWPANDAPTKASVVWDSHGLSIDAKNSSLRQILDDVAAATGAKVQGIGTDERIFGVYGPGQPRDVLSQLLNGSDYNVLMIGGQGAEPPQEIVLSVRSKGGMPQPTGSTQTASNAEEEPEAEEPPPQQPVRINPGFTPPDGVRTPQQIMREMMQRQQQMRQQVNPPQ